MAKHLVGPRIIKTFTVRIIKKKKKVKYLITC